MPTFTATAFSGVGAIVGTASIDPGPSGGGSIAFSTQIEVFGYGGGSGDVAFFSAEIAGDGTVSNFGTGEITYSGQSVEGVSGGRAEIDLFDSAIEAGGTVLGVGYGSISLDSVSVQGSGIQDNAVTSTDITFTLSVAGEGSQEILGAGDIDIFGLSVIGVGAVGPIGECLVEILFQGEPEISAEGWIEAIGQGELSFLPVMVIAAQGRGPDRFADLILRFEDEYQP